MITLNKRLDFIDIAKSIGIIVVMMSHSIGFPFSTGYYLTASYMALFFVLSGYTYKAGRRIVENIKRRTVKIGRAYFFYSVCLYIMSIVSKVLLHSAVTKEYLLIAWGGVFYSTNTLYYPRTVEPNISFFLVQNAPLWFLTCFIVAGLFFDIAFAFMRNRKGIIGAIIAGTAVTYLLSDIPIRLPWGIDTAFAGMVFMTFGYWMKKSEMLQKAKNWYRLFVLWGIYISLCIWNPGITMSVREYGEHGVLSSIIFIVVGCIGAILYIEFAMLICNNPLSKRVLCKIGQKTLPILAFHVFVFLVWDTTIGKLEGKIHMDLSGGILYWPIGILKIITALIICITGSWCFDKLRRGWKGIHICGKEKI